MNSKEIVISTRSDFQSDVIAITTEQVIGSNIKIRKLDPDSILTPLSVEQILIGEPLAIFLPLTWPNYLSLFAAEIIHTKKLDTKLILWSNTKTHPELILKLFDSFLLPPVDAKEIGKALTRSIKRDIEQDEIQRAIRVVLKAAHCFWRRDQLSSETEYSNYGEYLKAVRTEVSVEPITKTHSNKKKIKILVVLANPKGSDPLCLANEERVIKECIRLSKYRDRFELKTCPAAQIKDVQRALLDDPPEIIQFSGHGCKDGLCFEDASGAVKVPPVDALAQLLIDFSPPLHCAILNACYSQKQGEAISIDVAHTIVNEKSISDDAAIEFSRGFYDAIGAGKETSFAYRQGCHAVTLSGFPKENCPTIL